MPTNNEGGYELPPGLGDEIYSPFFSGSPIFLTTSQIKQLDSLATDVAALRASVNQITALLWQLVLKEQGIHVTFKPLDQTEFSGILSAAGLTLTEDNPTWTGKI